MASKIDYLDPNQTITKTEPGQGALLPQTATAVWKPDSPGSQTGKITVTNNTGIRKGTYWDDDLTVTVNGEARKIKRTKRGDNYTYEIPDVKPGDDVKVKHRVEFVYNKGAAYSEMNAEMIPRQYPPGDKIKITPDRINHVVNGDATGGGHGFKETGGEPGKTVFPKGWNEARIAQEATSVAKSPDSIPDKPQPNGRYKVEGTRDGVKIVAIVNSDGTIRTAWPVSGPGVCKYDGEGIPQTIS
ncbi:EndoU domain-containing protein [Nocardia sp. XZ_19_369]|uniref:EndoU domain-containing protein n=1 Tax=Nocardia sp. XZ_19_369 TaxID=2769487 RepID=UPI0027D2E59F|nr:EndoU domain-containing protein [Nocardia sp. XZ_19_369]